MNAVVNTTVLSNFASTQRLDLLRQTVGLLYLPVQVYDEIVAGRMAGYAFTTASNSTSRPLLVTAGCIWSR